MRARWILVVLVVLALVAPPGAAGADEAEPAMTDPCGVLDGGVNAMAPWVDICSADLRLRSPEGEAPVLEVTMDLLGDVESRTGTYYTVGWRAGGCLFDVYLSDASRIFITGNVYVGRSTAQVVAACGEVVEEPCEPIGVTKCTRRPPVTARVELGEEDVHADGSTIRWTVTFDGDLERFAGAHRRGAELTRLQAETWSDFWMAIVGGTSVCYEQEPCATVAGDRAAAERHVLSGP